MTESFSLTRTGRSVVLAAAFLGWLFGGVQMSITSLAMRSASIDLLSRTGVIDSSRWLAYQTRIGTSPQGASALSDDEQAELAVWRGYAAQWFAWYQCAFLFGAAAGGLLFGRLGDRIGRTRALAASVLCYSMFSLATYWVETPAQLLLLRFASCLGVGGAWPNGVALVSEAWTGLSRPLVAGVLGTAANVGIFAMATLGAAWEITPESWRWVMLVGAAPVVLGVWTWLAVPESPRWLAGQAGDEPTHAGVSEVFRPPVLTVTLIGILLATVPLIGGWGTANWMIPWAGEAGETADPPDPFLKARVSQARSLTGIVGSLLGGWLAHLLGRRRTYAVVSLGALITAQYAFRFTVPTDTSFLVAAAVLGWFNGLYFGWLPLFLPELFATRMRSAGSGVSFNFGRVLTAGTIFATGALREFFEGDFARIGQWTSLVFAVGLLAAWCAPDTSRTDLEQ